MTQEASLGHLTYGAALGKNPGTVDSVDTMVQHILHAENLNIRKVLFRQPVPSTHLSLFSTLPLSRGMKSEHPQQHRQTTFSHPALCHLKSSEVVFCAVIFRALSGPAHLLQNCIVLQVWVSHLWGHCSFLLGPRCAQGSVCALQDSVSQPCVSSGGSTVGLMATSSRRAYAIPRSAAPRAPAAGHC